MGIRNYLTQRKNAIMDNYRKNQQKEQEIRASEEDARFHARKEARVKRAVDNEYQKQGYYRAKNGNLKPNSKGRSGFWGVVDRMANASTNLETNMIQPFNNMSNTKSKRKRRKHTQARKHKQTRRNGNNALDWSWL